MLFLPFFFTSLVLSFAAAQGNTTFDSSKVDLTTKNQWCQGEQTNCPMLCGGQTHTKVNMCNGATLSYMCTCSNGTGPTNIADYLDTLPNQICQATFAQCRLANPGSQACTTCGTLQPTNVQALPASSSSAAATSSLATSSTATGASTSPTSSGKSGAGRIEALGGVIGGAIGLAAVML